MLNIYFEINYIRYIFLRNNSCSEYALKLEVKKIPFKRSEINKIKQFYGSSLFNWTETI